MFTARYLNAEKVREVEDASVVKKRGNFLLGYRVKAVSLDTKGEQVKKVSRISLRKKK
jgi:hypothetical protein